MNPAGCLDRLGARSALVSLLTLQIVGPNVYSNGGPFTECSYVCSN